MPIAFTLLFGFLFGGFGGGEDTDERLPVGFRDLDGETISARIEGFLEASTVVRPVILVEGMTRT
jgi:hypothetical protein